MVRKLIPALVALSMAPALQAAEPVDYDMVNRIREEGLRRSQVMETLTQLTDGIGPRLTGSPQCKEANEWTRKQLEEWGLSNARLEAYPFGRGWSFSRAAVHMTAPRATPLLALPKAWTPGTEGPVKGTAMRIDLAAEKDFEQHRGKLAGKILFLDKIEEDEEEEKEEAGFQRYSREDLDKIGAYELPGEPSGFRRRAVERYKFRKALNDFLTQEKVAATVELSSRRHGILRVGGGGSSEPGENPGVPSLVMAHEHYAQVLRHLEAGRPVELEIDVTARFHDDDTNAYNTLAEIPGTDKKDQIVMVGAHLDSWHAGTGATDNGAGVAVMMEAVRILKALGVKPRRTIRIGLWTGEEQGYIGSIAHVKNHFATRPATTDPEQLKLPERYRDETWPLQLKPGHAKFSAYFNLDNGTGKIRGIYAEENAALKPIFTAWLEPFHDLGADTVTLNQTGGTDHVPMDQVGLPGFQFIQDEIEYSTRTHHTNLDLLDRAKRDDLRQASVIVASFLYHAAMRDQPLPRKPLPAEPLKKKETKAAP
jgi:hypothetical protein